MSDASGPSWVRAVGGRNTSGHVNKGQGAGGTSGRAARVGIGAAFKLACASGMPPLLVALNLNASASEARGWVVLGDLLCGRRNGA